MLEEDPSLEHDANVAQAIAATAMTLIMLNFIDINLWLCAKGKRMAWTPCRTDNEIFLLKLCLQGKDS